MTVLPRESFDGRVRILLTGFGRFPGASTNPSADIVAEIARSAKRRLDNCGIELMTAILPVEFDTIDKEHAQFLAAARPDAILHLGLAGRRTVLCVETRAKNRVSQLRSDAVKRRSRRAYIAVGESARLKARLPAARLVATLRRSGAPACLSNDAGDYICNAVLHLSLSSAIPLAGFVHVPWPRRADRPLSRRRTGVLRPRRQAMVRAITAVLLLIGAQVRAQRAGAGATGSHRLTTLQLEP